MNKVVLELDEARLNALDQIASAEGRTREQVLMDALASRLDEEALFRAKVQEGIAAADRGDFADPEDVERVFAKYRAPSLTR